MGAYSGHPAKRIRLLLLVLGLAVVVAACGGNDARPGASSSITLPPTLTSAARSREELVRLFDYDRRRPLAVTELGVVRGR
jgi:hypothetical protein